MSGGVEGGLLGVAVLFSRAERLEGERTMVGGFPESLSEKGEETR